MASAPTQLRRILAAYTDDFESDFLRLQAMLDVSMFTDRLLAEGVPAIQAETSLTQTEALEILRHLKTNRDFAQTRQDIMVVQQTLSYNRPEAESRLSSLGFRMSEKDTAIPRELRPLIDSWIGTLQNGGSRSAAEGIHSKLIESLDVSRAALRAISINFKGTKPTIPKRRAQIAG